MKRYNVMSKREFRELVGISATDINVYKRRGNIEFRVDKSDGKEYVDLDSSITKAWIKRRQAKGLMPENPPEKKDFDFDDKEITLLGRDDSEMSDLEDIAVRKERASTLKLEHQAEIERMKRDKMAGETIPTEIVKRLFAQHFKSVALTFNREAQKVASVTIKNLGGDREDIAEFENQLEWHINEAIREAKEISVVALEGEIEAYVQKRGKGERK